MAEFNILSDDFAQAAAAAGRMARLDALASGHSVVFVDHCGRYVEELPDGRRFEIRLDASRPRESHRIVVCEMASNAA
jgi:hypothetical protein